MKLKHPFVIPEDRKDRLQVISSGGGTQSNCMIVMCAMGLLPKPDLILMADTEYEASNVFSYQKQYIKPICDEMGVEYVIIKKSDWTNADVKFNPDSETTLPGFFTEINGRDKNDRCNKQPGFCSDKWKKDPLQRYLNDRYGQAELTKRGVDFWIGMSLDEPRRVKIVSGKWQKLYPLFEARIVREQAIQIVKDYGLPEPPRSACWMCPNRHNSEWHWMKQNVPEDFAAAIAFEKQLQQDFPWLWLHKDGKPIYTIDFFLDSDDDKLDKHCDTGMCFV